MRTKEIDEKKVLATLANNPIAKQHFLDRQSPTDALSPPTINEVCGTLTHFAL